MTYLYAFTPFGHSLGFHSNLGTAHDLGDTEGEIRRGSALGFSESEKVPTGRSRVPEVLDETPALDSQGCHGKGRQSRCFETQDYVLSQSWGPGV